MNNLKKWFYKNFCLRDQIKNITFRNERLEEELKRQRSINNNGREENARLVERLNEADSKVFNLESQLIKNGIKP